MNLARDRDGVAAAPSPATQTLATILLRTTIPSKAVAATGVGRRTSSGVRRMVRGRVAIKGTVGIKGPPDVRSGFYPVPGVLFCVEAKSAKCCLPLPRLPSRRGRLAKPAQFWAMLFSAGYARRLDSQIASGS